MKNLFLTILVFFVIANLVLAQTRDEERERQRIVDNRIKKITQWSHRFKQGKPDATGYKTSETKYDKKGNPIEILNYKANGEISSKVLYKYNEKNQRIEYVLYQKVNRPEIEITNKQNYQYDLKGNKILEVRFDGATQSRVVYDYHPDNKPKGIVSSSAGNKIIEKWDFSYEGNRQVVRVVDGDQKLMSSINRVFDSNGNTLEETRFDAKGKELKKILFTFDASGKMIEQVESYSGVLIKKLSYRYNAAGSLTDVIQENPDGTKFTQSSYKHDTRGNLLEEKWSEGDPNEFSHKQSSYDSKGNPVEVDSYYAPYKFRVLYKYSYEYY